jgi:hypothetical protein
MTALAWSSFAVFVLATVAGLVVAARHGLATYRVARSTQRTLERELAPVLASAAAMEARTATASNAPVELQRAANELGGSVRELALMVQEAQDARIAGRVLRFLRA